MNVLVGEKANVETIKPLIEAFLTGLKGVFKTEWKVQAM
jgi:hypothetical protein